MKQILSILEILLLRQYLDQIIEIVENCESVQEDDGESDYHKDRAKINAYDDIVAILNSGGE